MPSLHTLALALALALSQARPDGPGGHHHHGHHGGHHASHGEHGHTVQLGTTHHQVGAQFHVQPENPAAHHTGEQAVHHAVHTGDPVATVHHAVHSGEPAQNTVQASSNPPVLVKSGPKNIAELVSENPKFSTLLTAVKAAGLVDTLAAPGPLTVFAPTNTAFDKVRRIEILGLSLGLEWTVAVVCRVTGPARLSHRQRCSNAVFPVGSVGRARTSGPHPPGPSPAFILAFIAFNLQISFLISCMHN